jgi:hypothetical protein
MEERMERPPSKMLRPATEQSKVEVRRSGRTGRRRATNIFVNNL